MSPSKSTTSPRFSHALLVSVLSTAFLGWCHLFQRLGGWWDPFVVHPGVLSNLLTGWGYSFFHANGAHLIANGFALIVLGTLSLVLYPAATRRALPLIAILSFLVVWLLGMPGSRHLGASGITYGLMALLTTLGLLRRDRPAIAAGLIVWFLFGGAWWALLPGYPDVSWEGHLGGALAGALAAFLWRRLDPNPFPPIIWDEEDEEDQEFPVNLPAVPIHTWSSDERPPTSLGGNGRQSLH